MFIESDHRSAALIHANATLCGVAERCAIIRGAAEYVLHNAIDGDPFDVVVLDPPYEHDRLGEAIDVAARHLAADGLLVVEHAARRALPVVASARPVRTLRSGDSALTMFERPTTTERNTETGD